MTSTDSTAELGNVVRGLRNHAEEAQRPDLAERLDPWVGRLERAAVRIVVIGPFKQGKSTLVNTLVGMPVCPVDDVYMTAIPTVLEFGPHAEATLVVEPESEEQRALSIPIDVTNLRKHVTDHAAALGSLDGARVEVKLPSEVLQHGLVLVDTPGIGGTVARHAATTLALLPTADALIVMSDASQEFTQPELSFLRQASAICPVVLCVQSKIDVTPQWRQVAAVNRRHLEGAHLDADILPISANLYRTAQTLNDNELALESGIPRLVDRLRRDLQPRAMTSLRQAAAREAAAVSSHLTMALQSELETLMRPGDAASVVRTLEDAQTVAAELNKRASKWQMVLNEGFNDLIGDIEYDIRDRIRSVGRDAELLIDESDPADTWDTMSQWLADAFADAIAESFVWAHQRCEHLATAVAESFRLEGEIELPYIPRLETDQILAPVAGLDPIKTQRLSGSQKLVGAMRGSYSGILMAGIITTLAGMALINPISVAAGAILGGFSLKQEVANRLERRRNDARYAVRRAVDETNFHVVKEAKSRLSEVKRSMRAEFEEAAEEFRKSLTMSIESAKRGAGTSGPFRDERTQAISDNLATVRKFASTATSLAEAGG